MYLPQISGVHALILVSKTVGNHVTFWITNATKVILVDGKVTLMLFNAMVTQVLLYGVEVWGDTITWNEIEKIQKMFLRRQLGVKCIASYRLCSWKSVFGP